MRGVSGTYMHSGSPRVSTSIPHIEPFTLAAVFAESMKDLAGRIDLNAFMRRHGRVFVSAKALYVWTRAQI